DPFLLRYGSQPTANRLPLLSRLLRHVARHGGPILQPRTRRGSNVANSHQVNLNEEEVQKQLQEQSLQDMQQLPTSATGRRSAKRKKKEKEGNIEENTGELP
ncbi:hypothetical protein CHS0354_029507, partial [Potamilus streckersoni]